MNKNKNLNTNNNFRKQRVFEKSDKKFTQKDKKIKGLDCGYFSSHDKTLRSSNKKNKKLFFCKDHVMKEWGFESKIHDSKYCGFAHGLFDQNEKSEISYISNLLFRALYQNDVKAFEGFKLIGNNWAESNFNELKRRSSICGRYLSCLRKLKDGNLTSSDLCTGGKNCNGGICGDNPNISLDELILDEMNWLTGSNSGKGIQLTDFGLIPFDQQKILYEKELEEERIKKICEDFQNAPRIGNDVKIECKWGSKDWGNIAKKIKEKEKKDGISNQVTFNGDIYEFNLKENESMMIHNNKPCIIKQTNLPGIKSYTEIKSVRQIEEEKNNIVDYWDNDEDNYYDDYLNNDDYLDNDYYQDNYQDNSWEYDEEDW